ncbi:hypothetical protein HMI55_000534 [Coelomomyces lativittatus]|nr:hypothetical protein HMI56_005016 [Coelomomyces lativittatus]KAJ1508047.1 hypothetical protein HMI55_000534 [Coelomomyces lativittatus]
MQGSVLRKRSPDPPGNPSQASNQTLRRPPPPPLTQAEIPALLPQIQRWPAGRELPKEELPDFNDLPIIPATNVTFLNNLFGGRFNATRPLRGFFSKIGYLSAGKAFFPIDSAKFNGKIIYTAKCEEMKLSSFVYAEKLFQRSLAQNGRVNYLSGYGKLFLRKEVNDYLDKQCSSPSSS